MKLFKKVLSASLVVILTLQCGGVTAFAEAPTTRTEYSDDGVVYTYSADGTVTATIYTSPNIEEAKPALNENDRLEDHGDSYVNTSEDVTVTLEKTYTDGDVLVSVESDGAGIVFYPETVAGAIPVETPEPVQAIQASEEAPAPGLENDSDSEADQLRMF